MQSVPPTRTGGLTIIAMALSILGTIVVAERPPQGKAATQAPKYKAIFEPVNYKQDLALTDVRFASEKEGWVSGAAGTILQTSNAGESWTAQLGGDPQGAETPVRDLRFANERTGFAAQSGGAGDHRLLRTTDGRNWTQVGTVGQHRGDYEFTSAENGVYLHRDEIHHTANGGKSWKQAYKCLVSVAVKGLTRQASCHFESMDFPQPLIGYAVSRDIGNTAFVVAKTVDGGATWDVWTISEPKLSAEEVVFTDENTGLIKMQGGAIYTTADGGKAWTGVAGARLEGGKAASIQFVGRDLGWGMSPYGTLLYTVDGGKRWSSRKLQFPAAISGFSLVSPTSAYVVGEHGMVYRYRVVPIDYKVPNMIDAPMMPANVGATGR